MWRIDITKSSFINCSSSLDEAKWQKKQAERFNNMKFRLIFFVGKFGYFFAGSRLHFTSFYLLFDLLRRQSWHVSWWLTISLQSKRIHSVDTPRFTSNFPKTTNLSTYFVVVYSKLQTVLNWFIPVSNDNVSFSCIAADNSKNSPKYILILSAFGWSAFRR